MSLLLVKLKQQIDELERQVKLVDFTDLNESYFDEHLFDSPKTTNNGSFYIKKIKQTYQALSDCIASQDLEKTTFLSETLINQMTALTRELSTNHLRCKEPTVIYESLSEKHSRHLEYLRRLQDMKFELELDPDSLDYSKIAAIDNRIHRCEQAIKQIELQMEDDSK